jgi:hypothetical protein
MGTALFQRRGSCVGKMSAHLADDTKKVSGNFTSPTLLNVSSPHSVPLTTSITINISNIMLRSLKEKEDTSWLVTMMVGFDG